MRQSQLFTKTRKEAPKDEVSKNAQLLTRAGFINKEMAGVYSYLPLGLRVLKKIEQIIREEVNAINGQELLMSALHPIENYQKTGREKIDILFFTELAGGGTLLLGQSHEEIVVPLVQQYVSSYRDLPMATYQFQTKFRNELRAKSGIMRGREFIMKDLYSFHRDEADFNAYYESSKKAYKNIFKRVGLGERTYITSASGGSFSKFSHEFQTLTSAGEDIIYICDACKVAVNEEVIDTQKVCPDCGKGDLKQEKSVEVGNIFPLKSKFSDAFGFTYKDEKGEQQPIIMGCYGIGLGRLMGTVVEVLSDDAGIIWPESIAPFQIHLISLASDSDEVIKEAEEIYKELVAAGAEVLFDDRDVRAGEKFADSDLIGIPKRIIISEKSLAQGMVEVKERASGKVTMVPLNELRDLM